MRILKYLLTLAAAFTLTTSIVGCETVEGAAEGGQEDMENIEEEIEGD
jgi:hypothetical protein